VIRKIFLCGAVAMQVATALGQTTAPTGYPSLDELTGFANSLCPPIEKKIDQGFSKSPDDVYTTFHDKVSILSVDLAKTDSVLHPVVATIAIRIYIKISTPRASVDCTEILISKVAKDQGRWMAISCVANIENETIDPPLVDAPDIGKTISWSAGGLQKIIDSIDVESAAQKIAVATWRHSAADLANARRGEGQAEAKLAAVTQRCLDSLHSTEQYKSLESKLNQSEADKEKAETDSNWQARLDADSIHNQTRIAMQNMESMAIQSDQVVVSAKQETETAHALVDNIEEKIRGDQPKSQIANN